MARTTNLRRQHDAACDLVGEIAALRDRRAEGGFDDYRLAMLLAKLTGLLRIHFAQEDKTLYPYMARSDSAEAADMAARFQAEMGDLGPVYLSFAERWATSALISADFAAFRAASEGVFAALANRITRENEELYPLADAIAADQSRLTA